MDAPAFIRLIDLAAERIGGQALAASDEFFAPKENLLKVGRGIYKQDEYTEQGKWMDGWETRRRRTFGHDWCVVRLGLPGIVRGVEIDTHHFRGNHPSHASLEACSVDGEPPVANLLDQQQEWAEILAKSSLQPDEQNLFPIADDRRWTHIRFNIYPDGGVARLRIYGTVIPDWGRRKVNELVDLAAVENGGFPVLCSDMFFSSMQNLIMPGPALNMGDGWETRRRRGPGFDWVILKLGRAGLIRQVEVDTTHFKGNYPDQCSLEGCFSPRVPDGQPEPDVDTLNGPEVRWSAVLPKTKLTGDTRHVFAGELHDVGVCTHVRLNIFPDGGVARLRIFGLPGPEKEQPSLSSH